jgi:glucose-fructose oxidoreductase
MDMGVYSLQGGRYMTGEEPIAVTAQTHTTRPDVFTEVDETTSFQLEFPSGALADLQTSFGFGMNYLRTTTGRGFIHLEPFQAYRNVRGDSSQGPIPPAGINQQAAQMDEVAYNISEGLPMRVPGEEGWRDMRVVEAIQQSIREGGRRITLASLTD